MDVLLLKMRKIRQAIQILDGYDKEVAEECDDLFEYIDSVNNLIEKRKEILERNKMVLSDQEALIEKLRRFQSRIEYMEDNYPQRIFEEDLSAIPLDDIPQNGQISSSLKLNFSQEKTYSSISEINSAILATPKPRSDLQVSVSYVSNQEFNNVPLYLKGRLKVIEVNNFIDTFNTVLTKKYELLQVQKKNIKNKTDLDKFVNWKSQINVDTKGLYFCTADDIFKEGGLKLGRKEYSLLTILRHTKRVREIRNKKVVFYAACF